MIHYHGSPFGGSDIDAAAFFAGRHGLVSYAHPQHIGIIAEVCQSFVLDNGAFSIWKKGGTLDVDGYIAWVRQWCRHPGFDWAVIPDVIGGTDDENDEMLALWPDDLPGVPVWHPHEPIGRLCRLADDWSRVAIGGSPKHPNPGSKNWWARISSTMDALCDEGGYPPCKLHGLRMLDPDIFTKLPLASADSINAARNANQVNRFGMYTPPSSGARASVIAERIEAEQSAPRWVRVDQQTMFASLHHKEQ